MDIEKLEKLNELKDKGILSEEEFNIQKKIILDKDDNNSPNKTTSTNTDKSLWKYFVECLTKKYCSFKGRASRKEFFGYMLFRVIFNFLCAILVYIMSIMRLEGVEILVMVWFLTSLFLLNSLFFLLPDLGVLVRRIQDAGYSELWVILSILLQFMLYVVIENDAQILEVFNVFMLIGYIVATSIPFVLVFFKSEEKENKYGPVPEGVLK